MSEFFRRTMQAHVGYDTRLEKVVFADVEIVINLTVLADHLGRKARRSKSKHSTLLGGAIVIKHLKDL